jgi:hypothetical protein
MQQKGHALIMSFAISGCFCQSFGRSAGSIVRASSGREAHHICQIRFARGGGVSVNASGPAGCYHFDESSDQGFVANLCCSKANKLA